MKFVKQTIGHLRSAWNWGVLGLVLALVVTFGLAGAVQAQNLVPNPSFESYSLCPTNLFQFIGYVDDWTNPTGGSPDYYNACDGPPFYAGVPVNSVGNQAARTGNAYAGFILRSEAASNYREYIEVPLTATLVHNVAYKVSFYVSLADQSRWAIDQLGAYLSVGPVGPVSNVAPLPVVPQVVNPSGNYITSKTAWTLVSGTYVALGGEDHLDNMEGPA